MKIIALGGAGMMAREAVRDLVETRRGGAISEIVVADADGERARALCEELGDPRLQATVVDARDEDALRELFRGARVVLNGTTYHHALTATRAAVAARVDYVDLGGLVNTPRQLELDEPARAAGALLCLGAGATPGITNVLARMGAEALDGQGQGELDEMAIYFASFRDIAPSPGLLDTILDEFSPETRRYYYERGELKDVPAFSGPRRVVFEPPVGEQTTYLVPHSETHTLPRAYPGVARVWVRGCWQPEIMELLRALHRFGLLAGPAKEAIRRQLLEARPAHDGEWAFVLRVEVVGKKDGVPTREVLTVSHPGGDRWGKTATARMTGIPASIAAQMICRGEGQGTGVRPAHLALDPAVFVAELAKRGILVHRRSEPA